MAAAQASCLESHLAVGRRAMNKELGVLMLLLAAETVTDCCVTADNALSTELFATSTTKMINNKVLSEPFDCISSAGDSDSATPLPESHDDLCDYAAPDFGLAVVEVMKKPLSHDGVIIDNVLSFLSWKEALSVRQLNRLWFEQSLPFSIVCRMPMTGCPAVFVPCRRDLDAFEHHDEAKYSQCSEIAACRWTCEVCGWTNERRALCGNRLCQSMSPITTTSAVHRIFLGQLRREATVPFLKWIFEEILEEPSALMMVENHRHKMTGRGKGCSWVYLRTESACHKLLTYHRRIFYDTFGGIEGAWIVHPSQVESLAVETAYRGYSLNRPRHLPRNAIVTELPAATMPMILSYPSPQVHSQLPPSVVHAAPWHPLKKTIDVAPPAYGSSGPAIRRHNPYASSQTFGPQSFSF